MRKNNLQAIIQKTVLSVFVITISFAGYSYAAEPEIDISDISLLESVRQNYYASERLESLRKNKTININKDVPANMWLKKVNANEVNMVTNRFTGEQQDAVSINGKTYFADGDEYAFNLKVDSSVRSAKDPVTNNAVDKADAVTYSDASGRVLYFESDMTFERFVGMANSETLYGYSK